MNKLHSYLFKYLLFSSPLVLILVTWSFFEDQQTVLTTYNTFIYVLWETLAWHLMIWFLVLIYILVILLISPKFRDPFLTKVAKIQDRDERESYLIGKSSRITFFSTLALLIFLLVFSAFSISINKIPIEKSVNGNQNELAIGFSFNILENQIQKENRNEDLVFSTQLISLSKESTLLLLIFWHLGTFYYTKRRIKS